MQIKTVHLLVYPDWDPALPTRAEKWMQNIKEIAANPSKMIVIVKTSLGNLQRSPEVQDFFRTAQETVGEERCIIDRGHFPETFKRASERRLVFARKVDVVAYGMHYETCVSDEKNYLMSKLETAFPRIKFKATEVRQWSGKTPRSVLNHLLENQAKSFLNRLLKNQGIVKPRGETETEIYNLIHDVHARGLIEWDAVKRAARNASPIWNSRKRWEAFVSQVAANMHDVPEKMQMQALRAKAMNERKPAAHAFAERLKRMLPRRMP